MRNGVPKVHHAIHCVLDVIDQKSFKAPAPVRVKAADQVREPLGIRVCKLARSVVNKALQRGRTIVPSVLKHEFRYRLLQIARHKNAKVARKVGLDLDVSRRPEALNSLESSVELLFKTRYLCSTGHGTLANVASAIVSRL
jgi:hypothetical protein